MAHPYLLEPATLEFLRFVEANNDRDSFNANKDRYLAAQANVRALADELLERLRQHDRPSTPDGKSSLFRIHNNLRFHKNRPPYKTHFGVGFDRVKPELRGGYYLHIKPVGAFVAAGFFGPSTEDLRAARMDILYDHETWRSLLNEPTLKKTFGALQGDQLRTAPRGFPKDHPAIDLLRHNQYLLSAPLSDKQLLSAELPALVDHAFRAVRPWFDHMSAVLTSNADGDDA